MKSCGEKIVALTAYDASFAKILELAGVEVVLIGDSLGMVLHGNEDTLGVSMNDMVYHTRQVAGATAEAMIIADMPYASYLHKGEALLNAQRLVVEGGADMVKLERGENNICEIVEHIVQRNIPVCGHLGLTPQSIKEFGAYKVQGKDPRSAENLKLQALALEKAGATMLVLECIPATLAQSITNILSIPVIGIGAGAACDGQVQVLYDILGISGYQLKLSHNFLLHAVSIQDAVKDYVAAVKTVSFPGRSNQYD